MRKKIIMLIVAVGLLSFIGGFLWSFYSVPYAVSQLNSQDAPTVDAAVNKLVNAGDKAIQPLSELLEKSGDSSSKAYAIRVLLKINSDNSLNTALRYCSGEGPLSEAKHTLSFQSATRMKLANIAAGKSENADIALQLLLSLGKDAVDAYESILDKGTGEAQFKVLAKLRGLPPEVTTPVFAKQIKSENDGIRLCAVETLGKAGKTYINDIAPLLTDKNKSISEAAIDALCRDSFQPEGLTKIKDFFLKDFSIHHGKIAKLLLRKGEKDILPRVIACYKQAESEVKRELVEALDRVKSPEAVEVYLDGLCNADRKLQLLSRVALDGLNDEVAPQIIKFMSESKKLSNECKIAVLDWLGKRKISDGFETAMAIMTDSTAPKKTRQAALKALIVIAGKDRETAVNTAAAKDPDLAPEIQRYVATSESTTVPELIKLLGADNREVAHQACDMLKNKGVAIIPDLRKAWTEPGLSDFGKELIIEVLIRFKSPDTKDILMSALGSENRGAQSNAVTALALIGEAIIPELLTALKDKNEATRLAAVNTINRIGSPKAVGGLIEALSDVSEPVANQAKLTLEESKDEIAPMLMENLGAKQLSARLLVGELAGKKCRQMTDQLITKLADKDPAVQFTALVALNYMDEKKAVPAIVNLLKVDDKDIAPRVLESLVRFNADALAPLADFIDREKEAKIRHNAMSLLCRLETDKRLLIISKYLRDEDRQMRILALDALGQPGVDTYLDLIRDCFKSNDPDIVKSAIATLKNISTEKSLNAIKEGFKHQEMNVRAYAVYALGQTGQERFFEDIAGMLKDSEPYVRTIVLQSLSQLNTKDAKAALPYLVKAATDADPEVRKMVVTNLAQKGGPNEIPVLLTLFKDPDTRIKNTVLVAFVRINSPQPIPEIMKTLLACKEDELEFAGNCAVAIQKLTNQDFGLKSSAEEGEMKEGVKKCRDWWEKEKGKYLKP